MIVDNTKQGDNKSSKRTGDKASDSESTRIRKKMTKSRNQFPRDGGKTKPANDRKTSEHLDSKQNVKANRKRPATKTKISSAPPEEGKGHGKRTIKQVNGKKAKLDVSIDNTELSDSDFEIGPTQISAKKQHKKPAKKKVANNPSRADIRIDNTELSEADFDISSSQIGNSKLETIDINSSSSNSDFEDVEEAKASTSGYSSKVSASSISETSSKQLVDFSQVDHQNFDISMLAKIEGIQLRHHMESEESDDDSDWEKVEGSRKLIDFQKIFIAFCKIIELFKC